MHCATGDAYTQIMQDRLMLMLKCCTASDDPDIARITRNAWRKPRRPRRANLRGLPRIRLI
jgi:hypothetical protein